MQSLLWEIRSSERWLACFRQQVSEACLSDRGASAGKDALPFGCPPVLPRTVWPDVVGIWSGKYNGEVARREMVVLSDDLVFLLPQSRSRDLQFPLRQGKS